MTTDASNGQWTIKSYPEQDLSTRNFELKREPVPEPGDGEFLIKTTHLIVTPPLRMALGTGGIARVGLFQFLQPVSGVILAWLILAETISLIFMLASSIIMAGVILAFRAK